MGPDFLVLQSPQGITAMTFSRYLYAAAFTSCMYFMSESRAATINVDTVLGPGHPYQGETITVIDGVSPPTRIELLDGAVVGGPSIDIGFDLFGQSRVTMRGGGVRGGEFPALLHDNSLFHLIDGDIFATGHIEARDSSTIIIDGGDAHSVVAFDSSTLRINGGQPGDIVPVEVHDQSHAVISGGGTQLSTHDLGTALIRGGSFGLVTLGGSDVLITDGAFADGIRVQGATVRIRGITGNNFAEEALRVSGGGEAHIYGFGLRFEVDDEAGPIITGRLADGDLFAVPYAGSNIFLHEVPEPATWGMLAVGLVGLLAVRRFGR
jgi:hypothetical protein